MWLQQSHLQLNVYHIRGRPTVKTLPQCQCRVKIDWLGPKKQKKQFAPYSFKVKIDIWPALSNCHFCGGVIWILAVEWKLTYCKSKDSKLNLTNLYLYKIRRLVFFNASKSCAFLLVWLFVCSYYWYKITGHARKYSVWESFFVFPFWPFEISKERLSNQTWFFPMKGFVEAFQQ